jgi:hypothetical protein
LKANLQFLTKAYQKAQTQSLYITGLIFGSSQITLSLQTSFRLLDYVRVAFICTNYSSKEIQLVSDQNVVLCGSRQGCEVALSTLLTWEGEPFAVLVGMSGWLPLDNWVSDVANGGYPRLHEDGDEFHDIEAFWKKDHEGDKDFDWPTKAVKYFQV